MEQNKQENIAFFANQINYTKDELLKIKLRAILLDMVHQSSIIEFLIENNVTTQNDWCWLQQLKFYLNNTTPAMHFSKQQQKQLQQTITIRMVYGEFEYSYEYLGNANKLVHTSLTHKCYLTLTQVCCMKLIL